MSLFYFLRLDLLLLLLLQTGFSDVETSPFEGGREYQRRNGRCIVPFFLPRKDQWTGQALNFSFHPLLPSLPHGGGPPRTPVLLHMISQKTKGGGKCFFLLLMREIGQLCNRAEYPNLRIFRGPCSSPPPFLWAVGSNFLRIFLYAN